MEEGSELQNSVKAKIQQIQVLLLSELTKKFFLRNFLRDKRGIHLGCGEIKIKDFVNVDIRPTQATDIVCDLNKFDIFPKESFVLAFSNAFLEHLNSKDIVSHLKSVGRILTKNGVMFYMGVPDFGEVAKSYLLKKSTNIRKKIDLEEVFKHTHGGLGSNSKNNSQTHKSLFDGKTIEKQLLSAGVRHFVIFNYAYFKGESSCYLGFLGFKKKPDIEITKEQIKHYASAFSVLIPPSSIRILAYR